MKTPVIGSALPNIPWQDKPQGSHELVWRYSQNPITRLHPLPGVQSIYNSAVVPYGKGFVGVFRAEYQTAMPYLHVGWSDNAIDWTFEPKPIALEGAEPAVGKMEYAYDPRVVKIEDRYYVTWCNGYHGPTIGIAWTEDFKTFHQLENAFLPYNRNGVLFPRRFGGKFLMLSRPSDTGHTPFGDIFISESPDMVYWGRHRWVMSRGVNWWQGTKIGAGPIPIETTEGWLLLYHGVRTTCSGFVYSMGVALLDRDNPTQVRYRAKSQILHPEAPYETAGLVPNVCFPCAALCDADTGRLAIYYGAADSYVALAFAKVQELLAFAKADSM